MTASRFKLIKILFFTGYIVNIMASKLVFETVSDCIYNRDFLANFSAQIQNGNIVVDMKVIKSVSYGLKGGLTIDFRMSKAKHYQQLFHNDIDFCSLIKGTRNTLASRWFKSMLKISNFTTSCPVPPGDYYLRGWTAEGNLVPSFFSFSHYRIEGSLYFGKYRKNDANPVLRCVAVAMLI